MKNGIKTVKISQIFIETYQKHQDVVDLYISYLVEKELHVIHCNSLGFEDESIRDIVVIIIQFLYRLCDIHRST